MESFHRTRVDVLNYRRRARGCGPPCLREPAAHSFRNHRRVGRPGRGNYLAYRLFTLHFF